MYYMIASILLNQQLFSLDVAEEALYRSVTVLHDGRIDYRNTKILLLDETREPEQESNM